jgi:hypothetical protein
MTNNLQLPPKINYSDNCMMFLDASSFTRSSAMYEHCTSIDEPHSQMFRDKKVLCDLYISTDPQLAHF